MKWAVHQEMRDEDGIWEDFVVAIIEWPTLEQAERAKRQYMADVGMRKNSDDCRFCVRPATPEEIAERDAHWDRLIRGLRGTLH